VRFLQVSRNSFAIIIANSKFFHRTYMSYDVSENLNYFQTKFCGQTKVSKSFNEIPWKICSSSKRPTNTVMVISFVELSRFSESYLTKLSFQYLHDLVAISYPCASLAKRKLKRQLTDCATLAFLAPVAIHAISRKTFCSQYGGSLCKMITISAFLLVKR
jgi:hypothetical protein